MKELKRTQVGEFSIENSITIEKLENDIEKYFITFEKYPNIIINAKKLELFLNGVEFTHELQDGIYTIYSEEKFIGIGTVKNKLLKRDIII